MAIGGPLARRVLREHGPFAFLLSFGLILRILAVLAVWPAIEFAQDSFGYIWDAAHPWHRDVVHPVGYAVFLRVLGALTSHFAAVAVAQHLLGLAAASSVYLLARRLGAGRWWGAVATAPLMLSGYQLDLEQYVLSDCLFEALLVVTFVVVLWPGRPTWRRAAIAGLLLGAACLTRTVGLAAVPVVIAYMLSRRCGWRPVLTLVSLTGGMVLAYAGWFDAGTGHFGLEQYDGYFLAGRVEPFADCRGLHLPPEESALCPATPVRARQNPDWFVWDPNSPLRNPQAPSGENRNSVALSFAEQVVLHQPFSYARSILSDSVSYLISVSGHAGVAGRGSTYRFPVTAGSAEWLPETPPTDPYIWEWTWPGNSVVVENRTVATHGFAEARVFPTVRSPLAHFLNGWEDVFYLPGIAVLGAAVVALLPLSRRMTRRRSGPLLERVSLEAAALAVAGLAVLLLTCATAGRDPRYLLPVEMLIWPAAAMVGAGLLEAVPARRAVRLARPGRRLHSVGP